MSKPVVMIAAGGTGGHLFPAFALTQELMRRGYEADLVTDVRADQYGIEFPGREAYQVPSATLRGRSPAAILRLLLTLAKGIRAARMLIKRSKPSVVIGFGGYPTVPPLLAAKSLKVPVVIHDANAVMGRANRLLARFADTIALSFDNTKHVRSSDAGKTRLVGMPVRDRVVAAVKPYPQRSGADYFNILVFGGSQGARVFADIMPPALAALPQAVKARIKLVQQVREEDMERVSEAYADARITAELAPFFTDLPERISASNLVIGRAGASTVAELTVLGRPAILVPLPHAIDNDQLENATRLQDAGAAWCVEQKDFTPERLAELLTHAANAPDELVKASQKAKELGQPESVARLADAVIEWAERDEKQV